MLHKKQIIVTPLLSFGILMGGEFCGEFICISGSHEYR